MSTTGSSLDSLLAEDPVGDVAVLCWEVGVVERRSEEQGLRLEALPRSLPLGSQSCLFASTAPTPRCEQDWRWFRAGPRRLGRVAEVGARGACRAPGELAVSAPPRLRRCRTVPCTRYLQQHRTGWAWLSQLRLCRIPVHMFFEPSPAERWMRWPTPPPAQVMNPS
jgi:hypothetical protein